MGKQFCILGFLCFRAGGPRLRWWEKPSDLGREVWEKRSRNASCSLTSLFLTDVGVQQHLQPHQGSPMPHDYGKATGVFMGSAVDVGGSPVLGLPLGCIASLPGPCFSSWEMTICLGATLIFPVSWEGCSNAEQAAFWDQPMLCCVPSMGQASVREELPTLGQIQAASAPQE